MNNFLIYIIKSLAVLRFPNIWCMFLGWQTSHVHKCQPVRLWVGHIVDGGRTGGLTTLDPVQGPSTPTGSPWRSDLPDQGQASDTKELCSPLYTVGTTYRDHLQFSIYITLSYILAPNVEKCYEDYFLSRPIYTYPSTINLVYHYNQVLLSRNYFYNHK